MSRRYRQFSRKIFTTFESSNIINGCCVGVSIETVLQIDKLYTVVRRIFELTFRTVVLRRSDEGLLSEISVRKTLLTTV